MIFSKRKPDGSVGALPIFVPDVSAAAFPAHQTADEMDAWRKRTDTDGSARRARQTKQDNELL